MPEPRRDRSTDAALRVTLEPNSRDSAAAKRRHRAGKISEHRGSFAQMPVEVRNGLPFKPYVYRGLGYDQLTGDHDA